MPSLPALPEAVALSYRAGDRSPRLVAKGHGTIAEEIIRRAREAGIYVHESSELVGMLMGIDLDRHIPPELYVVVAELLAWLHQAEQAHQAMRDTPLPPATATTNERNA